MPSVGLNSVNLTVPIRPEAIAQMRATARKALAPQCVQVIELTAQPFFQAILDLESPSLFVGRAALLGDAAFVARPHVGMGVTKAALDAECLADSLAQTSDIDAASRALGASERTSAPRR